MKNKTNDITEYKYALFPSITYLQMKQNTNLIISFLVTGHRMSLPVLLYDWQREPHQNEILSVNGHAQEIRQTSE
jgi:hypothetical protein